MQRQEGRKKFETEQLRTDDLQPAEEVEMQLSDGEWEIMKVLWKQAPRTIMQLVAALDGTTGWTKHTVISMLSRMEKKGAVYYEEGGRAKEYYPAVEEKQTVCHRTQRFLQKVYEGSLGMMVNTMVQEKALSKEEIDQLYDILKQAEEVKI